MIKKRSIGIILIFIGIPLAVFLDHFKNRYGFVDYKFDNYWIYFHYGYAFAIGIFLILIGTGLLMFSYSRKEIKKAWKEHKGFLIPLFLVNIIAVFLLLTIKQHVKVNNILHVVALITLVFVTWNYAKQTQNLVEQEKVSLEEQKKKNLADFWEGRLREYFLPLRIDLTDFLGLLSIKPLPSDEIIKSILKYTDFIAKAIMISKETMHLVNSLMTEFLKFKYLKEKGISEEKWVDDTRKKTKDLIEQNEVDILMLEHKIREAYSFYIDEKLAKSLEDFRKGFWGHDEKRKKS